ncbi:glycosyltransferase family 2 protein [Pseudoteredinibacter isoporae]|uniref:Glycosyltransferase involved in cell wall biosynthesis n=1 Tax=Pseudoteredinibacter isoporae TaxID=570281 RepID=A0A7X0MX36_9GAMM|nr:glycosyltransferase family A protein [Pseudoteredinibacter isoporae]MBB6523068.1 glycosyltransferase involved in cell wall biosynthesis [Pseudoteredinibacter isoporae]NHO88588.1 glycosyltransferase [Pseudoteredinibacter isoporae]NIB22721.1 glycosyltransferase [Pseudoteredinibacter isoporae]
MNMNSPPIFSVVVPMYNVEKYIDECIQSILDQTYERFEIICVDDGCTDKTVHKVKAYEDSRIRLIQQENGGLSAARNTGIRYSRGLYIAFLDSDDFWHPDKLQAHFDHFEENANLGLSYTASLFVDEESREMGIGQHPKVKQITARDIFCRNPVGNGSAPVLRRAALNQIAFFDAGDQGKDRLYYFDENLRQSEDVDCWLRLALSTQWAIEGIDRALCYYRVNSEGLSCNLEKQLSSWERAISKHRVRFKSFYEKHYSLAKAYQLRYLARRAVMNKQSSAALGYVSRSLYCNISVLFQEPGRTAMTIAGAFLTLFPGFIYRAVRDLAFASLAKPKQSG